jgi:prepilin-type N-terminal cleavage/methylation domain-containing protein
MNKQLGFTLIELMMVVMIAAVFSPLPCRLIRPTLHAARSPR